MSTGVAIALREIVKHFDTSVAVNNVSIDIRNGEFFSILGPSGCGKTTCLRLIAGLEFPTSGQIVLQGVPAGATPAYQRNVNTVFQSYALFPHLTVAENVAFGLKMRGVSRAEIARRVAEALALVQLESYDVRRPRELSGGQQQRVALARALINRPAVLLLDEPLAALDQQLRKAMQVELKQLQERLGITFVLVTHDQNEALTMSDRIAVMRAGSVLQIGTPAEIYERPACRFVASFVGEMNFLAGRVRAVDGGHAVVEANCGPQLYGRPAQQVGPGAAVMLAIRPERIWLSTMREDTHTMISNLPITVEHITYAGSDMQILVRTRDGSHELTVRCAGAQSFQMGAMHWRRGSEGWLSWAADSALVLTH